MGFRPGTRFAHARFPYILAPRGALQIGAFVWACAPRGALREEEPELSEGAEELGL